MANDFLKFVDDPVENLPDRTALTTPDGQDVSFRTVRETVDAFARKAASTGLVGGDHVVIEIPNHAVQICLMLALSRSGVVLMIGDTPEGFRHAGLRVDAVISNEIRARASTSPRPIIFSEGWFRSSRGSSLPDEYGGYPDRGAIAMICSTSGTTGRKKYVRMSYGALADRIGLYQKLLGSDPTCVMVTMTLDSQVGFNQAMRVMATGGHYLRPAGSPLLTLRLLNSAKVEELFTTPSVLSDLVASQQSSPVRLEWLKRVVVVGSSMPRALGDSVREHMCGAFIILFGATETGPVVRGVYGDVRDIPNAVGRAAPWAEVEVVDHDSRSVASGSEGFVRVSVPPAWRVDDYCGASAESDRESIRGKWVHTGDRGYLTEDGILVVTGRSDDRINVGGNKFSPSEVEDFAAGHPDVNDAACVSVPNEAGFDDIGVAVIGKSTLDSKVIEDWVNRKVGTTSPVRVIQVDSIPVNLAGKVDRIALRKMFASPAKPDLES